MLTPADPGTSGEPPPALCTRGMVRKVLSEPGPDFQDGAAALSVKGTPRGADKMKEHGPKQQRPPKSQGKEAPRDMLYYTQKLNGQAGADSGGRPKHSDSELNETQAMEAIFAEHSEGEENDLSDMGAQGTGDAVVQAAAQPTLADILRAVNLGNASVNTVREELSLLRQDLQKMRERTTAVESRVSEIEDRMTPIEREAKAAYQLAREATDRAEDFENRLRRNNVRIVGLPEKVEGRDPTAYVEGWLLDIFGKNSFSPLFAVERAHRVPARPPAPGGPPRPMLAKLLHYRDRETVLRQARERANIQHNGTRVSFYPDFSAEVQRRRAKFFDVKRRLRQLQLSYAMLYPAKLRVIVEGQAQFFDSAKDAANWLDRNEQPLRRRLREGAEEG